MGISTLGRVRFKRRTSHVSNLFSAKNVAVNPIYCVGEGGGRLSSAGIFFFFFTPIRSGTALKMRIFK